MDGHFAWLSHYSIRPVKEIKNDCHKKGIDRMLNHLIGMAQNPAGNPKSERVIRPFLLCGFCTDRQGV